jgi:hypothetical protein
MMQKRKILQTNNIDILREQIAFLNLEKQKLNSQKAEEMSNDEFIESFEKIREQKQNKNNI